MEARGLVLIAKLIVLAGDDLTPGGQPILLPSEARSILFLGAKDERTNLDEAALLDAVAIYTRDLGVTVVRSNDRRRTLGATPALTEISELLRSQNATLAFWCQGRADERSVELVVTDGRRYTTRHTFGQESPAGSGIYRAIALKLRSALTGPGAPSPGAAAASREGSDRASPRSPPAPSPAPLAAGGGEGASGPDDRARAEEVHGPAVPSVPRIEPAASGRGDGEASPARGPTVTGSLAPSTSPSRAASGPPPEHQLSVAIDYALSLPTGSAPWRNAAALHGIVSLQRRAEIDLGVEVAPAAEGAVPSGSVTVTDIPLRLGVRLLRRTNAYLIAAGPLAGVHVLFARATAASPERATESTRTVAASLGLEVLARGPSIRGFAPEVRLFGELNAPNTRFHVRGTTALEPGALTLGLGLGVIVPAP